MQCTYFCMDWPWDPFVLFRQLFSLYWGWTTLILVLIITLLTFVGVWMTTGLTDREKLLDNFQHRRNAISITPSWQVTFAAYWWSKAPPSWTETNQCGCSTPHRLHNTCRVSPAQGWACLVTGIVLQKSSWSMMKFFFFLSQSSKSCTNRFMTKVSQNKSSHYIALLKALFLVLYLSLLYIYVSIFSMPLSSSLSQIEVHWQLRSSSPTHFCVKTIS